VNYLEQKAKFEKAKHLIMRDDRGGVFNELFERFECAAFDSVLLAFQLEKVKLIGTAKKKYEQGEKEGSFEINVPMSLAETLFLIDKLTSQGLDPSDYLRERIKEHNLDKFVEEVQLDANS